MINLNSYRFAAVLVLIGEVLVTVIVLYVHPAGGDTIEATFRNDAASRYWVAIHLAQFLGMAVLLAGVLAFFFSLKVSAGVRGWIAFFGSVATSLGLALTGVVFAIDGVANKSAVDAWAAAPPAEQPTRLAVAEALRWIEIGAASYLDITLGLALVLLGVIIASTAYVPRLIGYLLVVSGIAFMIVGWLVAARGFTSMGTVPIDVGYGFLFISMIWVLVHGLRAGRTVGPDTARPVGSGSSMQR